MNNIKHLLDVVDKQRDRIALGLLSDPGLSKTSQIKQWAEENKRRVVELIISQRMPSEISGMPMPVEESRMMEIYDFNTLLEMEDGDVLFFDEFTNGNIQTLNACLTLIQERQMLSGKKLPSLLIVAAGNPQGSCELLPQTKQRFLWFRVYFKASYWKQYIKDVQHISVSDSLIKLIKQQLKDGFTSPCFNYWTPRTMENLLQLAKGISEEDSLWMHFPPIVVEAIYESLNNKEQAWSLEEVRRIVDEFVLEVRSTRPMLSSEEDEDLLHLTTAMLEITALEDLPMVMKKVFKGERGHLKALLTDKLLIEEKN